MSNKLYIANLSYQIDESALREAFERFGAITEASIPTDRETGRPRGFAFLTFESADAARAAIDALNGTELDGRAIKVSEARPKVGDDARPSSPGSAPKRNFGPDRKPGAFNARYRNRR